MRKTKWYWNLQWATQPAWIVWFAIALMRFAIKCILFSPRFFSVQEFTCLIFCFSVPFYRKVQCCTNLWEGGWMWTSGHIYNYVAHRLHMQMFHNKTATVSQHRSPSGLKAKHTSLLLVHPRFHTNPLHSACRWHHRVARNCYEAVYRHDLQSDWCCSINNLAFNTSKTKQMIISFSRQKENPAPLNKGGGNVENVPTLNSSAQTGL